MTSRLRRFVRCIDVVFFFGFRADTRLMSGVVTLTFVGVVASVAFPFGFKLLIDALSTRDVGMATGAVGLIVLFYAVTWAVTIVCTSELAALGEKCNLYLCTKILELINRAPTVEHLEREDFTRELGILESNRKVLAGGPRQCMTFLQMALRSLAAVVILTVLYPPFALLAVVGIVPIAGESLASRLRRSAEESTADLRWTSDELYVLATGASYGRELRLFGAADAFVDRYRAEARRIEQTVRHAAARAGLISGLSWVIFSAGLVAAVVIFVLRAADRSTSVGNVILGISLLRQMQLQVARASESTGQMGTIRRAAQRYLWLEDHVSEVLTRFCGDSLTPRAMKSGIRFDGVSFSYPGSSTPVLSDICLELPAGSVVAIVGSNGAGKTSLVKLIAGLYQPTSGTISIDAMSFDEMDVFHWREQLSAAFQDFAPYHLPAYQTVGIGDLPKAEDRSRVMTALRRAHSDDVVRSLPDGLETLVGRTFAGGQDLSGGQWQKLALGRAMMRDKPLVLLLDEPTANLDAPTEERLFTAYIEQARRRRNRRLTIVVSHRFATVRAADLIVVLDRGRVVATGSHQELMSAGGLYKEMYDLNARAYA